MRWGEKSRLILHEQGLGHEGKQSLIKKEKIGPTKGRNTNIFSSRTIDGGGKTRKDSEGTAVGETLRVKEINTKKKAFQGTSDGPNL